jgi:hypothetical protein
MIMAVAVSLSTRSLAERHLYGEMHRFISPVLRDGTRVTEIYSRTIRAVTRQSTVSRAPESRFDLMTIKFSVLSNKAIYVFGTRHVGF